jgi:acyl-coenzyme A synthetase/AMP-(fatty) acid ligase
VSALPPSTAEYVRFHARHRPGAIALIENGREIDYATFHRDLGGFTRAVRGLGLPRGSLVAVDWESCYLHWLLLLACENLGYATASFRSGEKGALRPLMARAQLVLSSRDVPEAGSKIHRLTLQWLEGVYRSVTGNGDAGPDDPLGLDEPQRIRRSSGTSGGPKLMVGTRRAEEARVERYLIYTGFTPQSRLLLTTHFTVGATYSRATACLRLGATCISDEKIPIAELIERSHPTHIWLPQFQLKPVLDALPGNFRKPADLTVMVGAAPLSEALWRRTLDRLASRVIYQYSCNEAGTVASVGQDGVCTLRPGVEAEIVDEQGAPVPAGEVGQLKVRTAGMVEGYLDNPEATARSFRGGWFFTSDAAILLEPGKLKLVGRVDEILNKYRRTQSGAEVARGRDPGTRRSQGRGRDFSPERRRDRGDLRGDRSAGPGPGGRLLCGY